MRYLLSYFFYLVGDMISRTIINLGNGYGFKLYNKIMLWSVDLDKDGKIWKYTKKSKKKSKKK